MRRVLAAGAGYSDSRCAREYDERRRTPADRVRNRTSFRQDDVRRRRLLAVAHRARHGRMQRRRELRASSSMPASAFKAWSVS